MPVPWHEFSFDITRVSIVETKWWVDLWILDAIVRAVVDNQGLGVKSWYVHRRSAGISPTAPTGHSFMFTCQAPKAETLEAAMRAVPAFIEGKFLWQLMCKSLPGEPGCGAGDKVTQEVWLDLMHGLSDMLLAVVGRLRCPTAGSQSADFRRWSAEEAQTAYAKVDEQILRMWNLNWGPVTHHIRSFLGYPWPHIECCGGQFQEGPGSRIALSARQELPHR